MRYFHKYSHIIATILILFTLFIIIYKFFGFDKEFTPLERAALISINKNYTNAEDVKSATVISVQCFYIDLGIAGDRNSGGIACAKLVNCGSEEPITYYEFELEKNSDRPIYFMQEKYSYRDYREKIAPQLQEYLQCKE